MNNQHPKPDAPEPPEAPEAPPIVRFQSVYPSLAIAYNDGYIVFVAGRYETSNEDEIAFLSERGTCERA